uniref:Uncharacterized protein n=1 Tax=Romanomermis culicivorax TaxID=13658 RepID=A0A915L9U1_ROMCU
MTTMTAMRKADRSHGTKTVDRQRQDTGLRMWKKKTTIRTVSTEFYQPKSNLTGNCLLEEPFNSHKSIYCKMAMMKDFKDSKYFSSVFEYLTKPHQWTVLRSEGRHHSVELLLFTPNVVQTRGCRGSETIVGRSSGCRLMVRTVSGGGCSGPRCTISGAHLTTVGLVTVEEFLGRRRRRIIEIGGSNSRRSCVIRRESGRR